MIPLKLCIKNFLSYGDTQEIDFTGYHLICLSGKNGHGKSALLDALTWALWGQARKITGSSKADLGLMRLGQKQMMVCLDFQLGSQLFRVRRELEISRGKATASLDFGIVGHTNETFIPLTDKTIRATQHKIDETLRLDFDSFINSAFLRQGQANEFSKKSPKERKEIFAAILGLNRYEEIKKLALEKSRLASNEHQTHLMLCAQLKQEILKKDAVQQDLLLLTQELTTVAEHDKKTKELIDILAQEKKKLVAHQRDKDQLLFKKQQLTTQQLAQQALFRDHYGAWKLVSKKSLQSIDYQGLIEDKKSATILIDKYQQLRQESIKAQEELMQLKQAAQELANKHHEAQRHIIQHHHLTHERLKLEKESHRAQLTLVIAQKSKAENDLIAIDTMRAKIDEVTATKPLLCENLQAIERQFEKRKAAYQEFSTLGTYLTNELRSIEQKKQFVGNDNDPSCPLCEQNLSATRRRFLRGKLTTNEQLLTHQTSRLAHVVKKLKPILIEQHQLLERFKAEIATLQAHEAQAVTLEQQKIVTSVNLQHVEQEIAQKNNLLTVLESKIKETVLVLQQQTATEHLAHVMAQDALYQSLCQRIATLEQKMLEKPIDQTAYAHAQALLTRIENELCAYETFRVLAAQQQLRAQEIVTIGDTLKLLQHEIDQIDAHLLTFESLKNKEHIVAQKEEALTRDQQNSNTTKENLLEQKGRLQAELAKLVHLEKELISQEESAIKAQETAINYQTIAQATGKDGIQALLIEDAIPEIEDETNKLLDKLTNNQAHLFIESLRDLKKGGVKETLDIKISDAAGIRPYEMFSGGEAFRIDFALRIAISKLLARRAGTTLQTLIIDEGFGSQDEEGLAHIMDAIYALQDDFEKVIIVSHLDSMKEQFPVHFGIEKGPSGSVVRIIEQG